MSKSQVRHLQSKIKEFQQLRDKEILTSPKRKFYDRKIADINDQINKQ